MLHAGQERQCSHCLRSEGDCPGAGVGKVCYKIGTARGLMADYMKHLFLHHSYMSLKMKYSQVQFPLLGSKGHASDGFGHIVEVEKGLDDTEPASDDPSTSTRDANRIADLEAELSVTRDKLDKARAPKVIAFDVPQELFDYDESSDEIFVKDEAGFDSFVDLKCTAQVDRDLRKDQLRNKMLHQVKQIERRKRNLSTGSLTSLDSPSRRRGRSTDSTGRAGVDPKQSRQHSQPALP